MILFCIAIIIVISSNMNNSLIQYELNYVCGKHQVFHFFNIILLLVHFIKNKNHFCGSYFLPTLFLQNLAKTLNSPTI